MEVVAAQEERVRGEVCALAAFVRRHRLEDIITLFIEMHRPMRGLLENALVIGGPVLSPLLGSSLYDRMRLLIETPGALESFEAELAKGMDSGARDGA